MPRYVNAVPLIEQAIELEALALKQEAKYDPSEDPIQWNTWMAILTERTAFKYDLIDAPTVDAVEVVRCIECRYYETTICPVNRRLIESWGRLKAFCSWGKRKDDVND